MSSSLKPVFRFGPFELRAGPPALYRDGRMVSVTPKGLATLAALVSQRGEAVSKDDLLSTVWPDAVVEEASLTQNIYTLRKLLAQDFPGQNAIENIPRFGYRFTLPVEEAQSAPLDSSFLPSAKEATPDSAGIPPPQAEIEGNRAGMQGHTRPRRSLLRLWWPIALAVIATAIFAAWALRHRAEHPSDAQKTMPYEAIEFTSNSDEDRVTAVALSPSGNLVAYADTDGIILRGTDNVSIRSLPSPKLAVVNHLAWFPDQQHLVASGEDTLTGKAQVWRVSALGEPPMLLRDEARLGVPSHNGSSVALITANGAEVWVTSPSGENARRVTPVPAGDRIELLLWSLHDDGFLLERQPDVPIPIGRLDSNPALPGRFLMTFERVDLATGNITSAQTNLSIGDACLTANGDILYTLITSPHGNGAITLWRSSLSAAGAIEANAKEMFEVSNKNYLHAFSCSSDGSRIASLRNQGSVNIYVGELGRGGAALTNVKRLSFDSNSAYPHAWSADSRSVFYESARGENGQPRRWQLTAQSLDRHDAEAPPSISSSQTLSGSQTRPIFTPDQRWMLFVNRPAPLAKTVLLRVSPQGGAPVVVPGDEELNQFRCPLSTGNCIVRTMDAGGQTTYSVLDPVSGKGKVVFKEPASWSEPMDWDISPDGSTLVVSTISLPDTPLHTVSLATGSVQDIAYHPSQRMASANWAADGKGFFLSTTTPSGNNLCYVDLAGRSTLLRTTNVATYGVPSPNGHSLAFVDRSLDSNVWLLQAK